MNPPVSRSVSSTVPDGRARPPSPGIPRPGSGILPGRRTKREGDILELVDETSDREIDLDRLCEHLTVLLVDYARRHLTP